MMIIIHSLSRSFSSSSSPQYLKYIFFKNIFYSIPFYVLVSGGIQEFSGRESPVAASNVPCSTGMFQCNNGKCISSLWVCNYQKDCDDGEDEQQSCRKYTFYLLARVKTSLMVGGMKRQNS